MKTSRITHLVGKRMVYSVKYYKVVGGVMIVCKADGFIVDILRSRKWKGEKQ